MTFMINDLGVAHHRLIKNLDMCEICECIRKHYNFEIFFLPKYSYNITHIFIFLRFISPRFVCKPTQVVFS